MNETCSKCGRAKSSDKSSITQWIVVCQCDFKPLSDEPDEDLDFCETCKKRITTGRTGSLTQWIFRSDSCTCSLPQPKRRPVVPTQSEISDTIVGDNESALDLQNAAFPTDRYKPLAVIGSGASGVVYRCRDLILCKQVAVKQLHMVTAEQLMLFQSEAKATSQLKHPGIVEIMDFGASESGAPYMVLEYAPGPSLLEWVKQHGPMSADMAVTVFTRIAEALAYAHSKGVLHRDITSSNLLIVREDREKPDVRLIDFGIAKTRMNQETTVAKGTTMVGTPAYMPPDQARGLKYDERSEIYSLGCVMFEALSGRPPFVGVSSLETIGMHANTTAPLLNEVREDSDLPESLVSIVDRCLSKNPDDRWNSMNALAEALDQVSPSTRSRLQAPEASKFISPIVTPKKKLSRSNITILVMVTFGLIGSFAFLMYIALKPSSDEPTVKMEKYYNPDEPMAAGEPRKQSIELSADARKKLEAGLYKEALAEANEALKKWEFNSEALDVSGLARLKLGDKKTALNIMRSASQIAGLAEEKDSIMLHLSVALYVNGHVTDAASKYAEIVRHNYEPTNWEKEHLLQAYCSNASIFAERNAIKDDLDKVAKGKHEVKVNGGFMQITNGNDNDLKAPTTRKINMLHLTKGSYSPAVLSSLKNLENIFLDDVALTDAHAKAIANLPKLHDLIVTHSWPKNGLQHFKSTPLRMINMFDLSNFDDDSLAMMANLKQLKTAVLDDCAVNGTGWSNCKQLEMIDWRTYALSYPSLKPLSALPKLRELQLDSLKMTDTIFGELQELKHLEILRLSGAEKVSTANIATLRKVPQLTTLFLTGPLANGQQLRMLDRKVKVLELFGSRFEDRDIAQISLMKLDVLILSDQPELTPTSLGYLSQMKGLKQLTLGLLRTPYISRRDLEKLKRSMPGCNVFF